MHNLDMTVGGTAYTSRRKVEKYCTAAFATCDVGPTDPLGVVPANFISLKNFDTDRSSTFFCNNPIISMVLYPAPKFCGKRPRDERNIRQLKFY